MVSVLVVGLASFWHKRLHGGLVLVKLCCCVMVSMLEPLLLCLTGLCLHGFGVGCWLGLPRTIVVF